MDDSFLMTSTFIGIDLPPIPRRPFIASHVLSNTAVNVDVEVLF